MTRDDWNVWVIALHRPPFHDDEEAPAGVDLVPWWRWLWLFQERYGSRSVVCHGHAPTPGRARATLQDLLHPLDVRYAAATDYCNGYPHGECTGACEMDAAQLEASEAASLRACLDAALARLLHVPEPDYLFAQLLAKGQEGE